MILRRTSPWDAESAAHIDPRRAELIAVWNGRAQAIGQARPRGRHTILYAALRIALTVPIVLFFCWRLVAPRQFDAVMPTGLRIATIAATWLVMGAVACAWLAVLFNALKNPAPVNARAIRAASWLRIHRLRALARQSGPVSFSELGAAHADRTAHWRERLKHAPSLRSDFASIHLAPMANIAVGLMTVVLLPGTLARLAVGDEWSDTASLYASLPVLGLIYAQWILAPIRHRVLRRRLRLTLDHSRCPQCSYDLHGVPPAFPHEASAALGPALCPECGSPWPLVPPPPVAAPPPTHRE